MKSEKLAAAIASHVKSHRVVIWYDPGGEHRDTITHLDTPDATVLEVANNELAIKHRILVTERDRRFIIYAPFERPPDEVNWLLDVTLFGFPFTTNLSETRREELGLPVTFRELFERHAAFFENQRDRMVPLSRVVDAEADTPDALELKMVGVLMRLPDAMIRGSERDSRVLRALMVEAADGKHEMWDAIVRYGLDAAWRRMVGRYLRDPSPDITPAGAAIELFRSVDREESGGDSDRFSRYCAQQVSEWQFGIGTDGADYHRVVRWVEKELSIARQAENLSMEELERRHLFPAWDEEFAHRLLTDLDGDRPNWAAIAEAAAMRRSAQRLHAEASVSGRLLGFVESVARFHRILDQAEIGSGPADALITHYRDALFRVDQLHRQILERYRTAETPGAAASIVERVDGRYVHQFLQPLAEAWSRAGGSVAVPHQERFFRREIEPFLRDGGKVVVIVSDALRYEVGEELVRAIRGLERATADLDAMMALAPTVTAVGMAALLPHDALQMEPSGAVLVDGRQVEGVERRSEHIRAALASRTPAARGGAFRMRDILELSSTAAREQFNGLDVVYLYSDQIDATGDNFKTESDLPAAVARERDAILRMVRKIGTQLNRTHILITADHGFLYQHTEPTVAHTVVAEKPDEGRRERRFVVGPDGDSVVDGMALVEGPEERVVACSVPIRFAPGIARIRKQGGGIRYVHGGLTIQERLVPLIRVKITRFDGVTDVPVSLMKPGNAFITTPTYTIRLIQEQPVSDAVKPIVLRARFVSEDGTTLSDLAEMRFDSTDPAIENRGRAIELRFGPDAVRYNGRDIFLVLQRIEGGAEVEYQRETFRYQTIGERDF